EAVLRGDPADVYAIQDFASRDRCRRAVEKLARRSTADELEVARRAVELARGGRPHGAGRGHGGYYPIDGGQADLKAQGGYRPDWRERLLGWTLEHPGTIYFGALACLLVSLLVLLAGAGPGVRGTSVWLPLTLLVLLLPVSELAVGLVNHLLTLL